MDLHRPRPRLGPRPYEPYLPLLCAAVGSHDAGAEGAAERGRLAEAALYHGVAGPLLEAALAGRLAIDPGELAAIEAVHTRQAVLAALLRAELPRVAEVVTAACELPPILIKGPAVADRFYENPAHRPFDDLDLLVPFDAVERAAAALEIGRGSQRTPLPWPRELQRHGHAVELRRRHGVHTLLVELHWRISDDPLASALGYEQLVARAQRLPGDLPLLVPDVPDQLQLLAVHLLHHAEKKLGWLVDLDRITRRATAAEWEAAFARGDAAGLGWVLDDALDLAERHLGTSRARPRAHQQPVGWGPLRMAGLLGEGALGYHAGHLAALPWPQRAAYLSTGIRGLAARRPWRGAA